jgi:hypothetical protein
MNALASPPKIDPSFIPKTHDEIVACLNCWEWRIFSGQLYCIMAKEDEGDDDSTAYVMPFIPNQSQRAFLKKLHYRNIILKARQLGFTTLIAILWLDHALFNADQRCCIIAHTKNAAERILRDKVLFAYNRMPEWARDGAMGLLRQSAEELVFEHNNSAIEVTVSARSGTFHRLHVSEMGKVAAKQPQKAAEIVTGSLPSVPSKGVAVIESTAEGSEGAFYEMTTRAEELFDSGEKLKGEEWAFHFFPWWKAGEYESNPEGVTFTDADHEYFAEVEAETGAKISLRQRAWYVLRRENDFAGDQEQMWREMPSTSKECWQKSTEGTFFARQFVMLRKERRITTIPHIEGILCHTFWDIGASDGTGVWIMQHVGAQHRFLRYIEGWSLGYAHFIKELRETGFLFGAHYLPHDAENKRQTMDGVRAPIDDLRQLAPDWHFNVVPRVHELLHGINQTRAKFNEAWFDAEGCKDGLEHLRLYRKKWNSTLGVFTNEPEKLTGHSEAADAFRQWAQGYDPTIISGPTRPRRRNRPKGGMWV